MSLTLSAPKACIVRSVSPSFESCLREAKVDIDAEAARSQHARYIELIGEFVPTIIMLESSEDHPDCCYVEDVAVCINRFALITRPGAPTRRGECEAMVPELAEFFELVIMEAPATLDGGDVMRVGNRFFVGRSARTNDEGINILRDVAERDGAEVIAVDVPQGLHLKSACTMLDENTVVIDPAVLSAEVFSKHGLLCIEACESLGANVLAFGSELIASEAAPKTIERLRDAGYSVHTLCVDELHKGDGALSCLSIRIPREDHWAV